MSLKAKLEAVIYAAEEPVTLTQLAVLFAPEALEWKAEQEAARAAAAAESGENQTLALLQNESGDERDGAGLVQPGAPAEADAVPESAGATTAPEAASQATAEPGAAAESEAAEPDGASAEADEKKLARLRDREVRAILRQLLDEIIAVYASDGRGVEIREIAGGYRMATKPECHDAVRQFVKSLKPVLKLSLPALETLAVIAYKQPVTAPEVNEIRGVESSGVFGSLLARKLIATAGRKQVIGRPILYKTTREFLLRFGLKDVSELPSMEEFEKMAALEFEETEAASEEQNGSPDEAVLEDAGESPELSAPLAESGDRETAGATPNAEPENAATNETAVTADHNADAPSEESAATEPVAS